MGFLSGAPPPVEPPKVRAVPSVSPAATCRCAGPRVRVAPRSHSILRSRLRGLGLAFAFRPPRLNAHGRSPRMAGRDGADAQAPDRCSHAKAHGAYGKLWDGCVSFVFVHASLDLCVFDVCYCDCVIPSAICGYTCGRTWELGTTSSFVFPGSAHRHVLWPLLSVPGRIGRSGRKLI